MSQFGREGMCFTGRSNICSLNPWGFFDLFRHLEDEIKLCQPLVNKHRLENHDDLSALHRYESTAWNLPFSIEQGVAFRWRGDQQSIYFYS